MQGITENQSAVIHVSFTGNMGFNELLGLQAQLTDLDAKVAIDLSHLQEFPVLLPEILTFAKGKLILVGVPESLLAALKIRKNFVYAETVEQAVEILNDKGDKA